MPGPIRPSRPFFSFPAILERSQSFFFYIETAFVLSLFPSLLVAARVLDIVPAPSTSFLRSLKLETKACCRRAN
jgi:hypothetical protein